MKNHLCVPADPVKLGKIKLSNIYLTRIGKREGFTLWVVNSDRVCADLYPPFLMGGNDQRYRFNPENEIWLDNYMCVDELETTLAHEVLERNLMRERGWTYDKAHESLRSLDTTIRNRHRVLVLANLSRLYRQEHRHVEVLSSVYRGYYGTRKGVRIWLVDGWAVRQKLSYNFGFPGGHDLMNPELIPAGEMWLDAGMPVGQLHYALVQMQAERTALIAGATASDAYERGLEEREEERKRQEKLCLKHEARLPPVSTGVRVRGHKVP